MSIRSAIVRALALCAICMAAPTTLLGVTGCSQKQVTGEAPAEDAEMKTVIINVFGMT